VSSLPPPPPSPPPPSGWAPPTSSGGWGPPPVTVQPWRSLQGLSTALTVLLIVVAVLAAGGVGAFLHRDQVWSDGSLSELDEADDIVAGTAGLLILAGVAVFVVLVVWTYRAARNLEALGRPSPTLGAGWAIGGWFIPFANLVLPFLVLRDVWKGGEPGVPRGDPRWKQVPVGAPLIVWWSLWVASWVAWAVLQNLDDDEFLTTTEEVRRNTAWGSVAMGLSALAAVAAIVALRAMTRRQHAAWSAQTGVGPAGFPVPGRP